MLQTLETEKIQTKQVFVDFDESLRQYYFYFEEDGEKDLVMFNCLPLQFDIRQGYRKFDYLKESLISSETGHVSIQVPFLVTPQDFFGQDQPSLEWEATPEYINTYTLIQGNTRLLYLQDIFAQNIALYNSLEDKSEFTEKELKIDPFYITVLDAEKLKSPSYILWLQNSINNGVEKHRLFDEIRAYNEHLNNLTRRNKLLPKEQQKGTKELRLEAIKPFGIAGGLERTYHWTKAASEFPKWLGDCVNESGAFDLYFHLFNKYKAMVKAYTGFGLQYPDLRSFYQSVSDEATQQERNISQPIVDKVYKEFLDKLPKPPKEEVQQTSTELEESELTEVEDSEEILEESEVEESSIEDVDVPQKSEEEWREDIQKQMQELAVTLYQSNSEIFPENGLAGISTRFANLAAFLKRNQERWDLQKAIQGEPEETPTESTSESSELVTQDVV